MRSSRLLLPLCLLLAAPAFAQEADWHRFYPLDIGDNWTYRLSEESCAFDDCTTDFEGYERRTVIADTVVEGISWSVLRLERLDLDGETILTDRCLARVTDEGTVEWAQITGECAVYERLLSVWELAQWDFGQAPDTIEVGDTSYEVEASRYYDVSASPGAALVWAAADVGVYKHSGSRGPDQTRELWNGRLVHAEVGGVTYGQNPVANEAGAVAGRFVLGSIYPNPARGGVAVTLALPQPETVALEAFDVLGRRVLRRDLGAQPAGESRHQLDLSRLPAGLYVVRATTASGETAVQRVTKVD